MWHCLVKCDGCDQYLQAGSAAGGDSTMTQHQQETIRELRGQLEDTKREMAAGRLRCNQLEKELAASKQ